MALRPTSEGCPLLDNIFKLNTFITFFLTDINFDPSVTSNTGEDSFLAELKPRVFGVYVGRDN